MSIRHGYLVGRPVSTSRAKEVRLTGARLGSDLESEEHRLVVVSDGCLVDERRVAHCDEGRAMLLRRPLEPGLGRVAIEQPNGWSSYRLLDAGIAVVALLPNQLTAAHERSRFSGARSEGFDSDRDQGRGRWGRLPVPATVEQHVGLANQPCPQLEALFAGAASIVADVDSAIVPAFVAALRAAGRADPAAHEQDPRPAHRPSRRRDLPLALPQPQVDRHRR